MQCSAVQYSTFTATAAAPVATTATAAATATSEAVSTAAAAAVMPYLTVWLGTARQLAVPVGGKLHGLVHVVLVLLRGQHQLHIRVYAAVALIGVASHNLLAVHAGRGGAGLAHGAGQGELQLTADTSKL